jgi:hypothetical protein
MSVFATDSTRFSAVVKHEYEPSIGTCRDVVTVNDSAVTLRVGAVLGKVTATGKYKLVEATAVDGSQVAAAIVIADSLGNSGDIALAATTDTQVLVLTRGPAIVSSAYLQFGASVDTNSEFIAQYAALKALGIVVETAA